MIISIKVKFFSEKYLHLARNSSFGFFGLALRVGKNQMCYGAVGFLFFCLEGL